MVILELEFGIWNRYLNSCNESFFGDEFCGVDGGRDKIAGLVLRRGLGLEGICWMRFLIWKIEDYEN